MTFWNSRYAAGARLIAVPGWPLPTFCTASMASTRTVSTALSSSSFQSRSDVVLTALLSTACGRLRHYSAPRLDSHRLQCPIPPVERTSFAHSSRPSDLRRTVGAAQHARRGVDQPGAGDGAGRGGGLRRADQAARDRAAAADHRA